MERETGLEPATSSLGRHTFFESNTLARFCSEFLNLQHLAKSAFSKIVTPNEAQTRQVPQAIVRTIIDPAKDTDVTALRLCLEKLVPNV
jgi:hypothetical protein